MDKLLRTEYEYKSVQPLRWGTYPNIHTDTLNTFSLVTGQKVIICGWMNNAFISVCVCIYIYIYIQCVPLEGSPGKCWFISACHTCMKCGCHRRCWKCPPVCSMYTWLVYSCVEEHGPNYSPLS
jgi:hypothetical protein